MRTNGKHYLAGKLISDSAFGKNSRDGNSSFQRFASARVFFKAIDLIFGEFAANRLVNRIRIRLALSRLHYLPDKKAQQFFLSGAILRNLIRMSGDDVIHGFFQGGVVGNLPQSFFLNDGIGRFAAFPHFFKDRLGDFS